MVNNAGTAMSLAQSIAPSVTIVSRVFDFSGGGFAHLVHPAAVTPTLESGIRYRPAEFSVPGRKRASRAHTSASTRVGPLGAQRICRIFT
jgi:hypothetical protein